MTDDTKYCLCCNEQVPFSVIEKNEKREARCVYCGFTLDIQKPSEPKIISDNGHALVADDSKYTRKIITDILTDKNHWSCVESFGNGAELLSAYSTLLSSRRPVDVVIIDLNMPVMDGLTAARTMRSLEVQKRAEKVPMIFFSSEKADEHLKRQMDNLAPAHYMNKAADPDPDKLAMRVEQLVEYILEEKSSGKDGN
jgi:CheY-like chemotaxis protein/DNA-directed RNA polymerase subunit RPC12/RpoP